MEVQLILQIKEFTA